MYRVRAVAEALDVSVATIYRAIEAGKLNAFKIGTGKGALRIPGEAIPAYLDECANAACVAASADGGES
ncbi:helix-turn-helix domain-containing protein [Amycolatopsis sp. RM579]|uniref:Helix-turn-helix domain-containing protein n=2 Tax=Amycolatopsis pithecellobii TaxID=664692 RepID=A0A6N7Z925_9PSEU|nr:helix-turn-helix domain-containing protein [Amycolatopsis pithecellobii]